MRTVDNTNFSGGIHEATAPSDFTERQWTTLKGFYLKDETRLKTQWPLQSIGSATLFKEIRPLVAYDGTKFIIGIKSNGEVWRTPAPANSAVYTTANASTWTRITSSNGTATLTVGANAHFVCEIGFQVSSIASNKRIPALVINQSTDITDTIGPIIIWAESSSSINAYRILDSAGAIGVYPGYVPPAPSNVVTVDAGGGNVTVTWVADAYPGTSAVTNWKVYDSGGTLKATIAPGTFTATFTGTVATGYIVRGVNAYGETPFDAAGGVVVPGSGYMPRGNVGIVWAGQLILGDIEYYKDDLDITKNIALSSSNSTRVRNGIWFSNIDTPTTFDPLAMFTLGSPDTIITGFTLLPQGVLVTTTNNSNQNGIYLLRGNNIGTISSETISLGFYLELVRGGISAPDGSPNPGVLSTLWPAVGTVAFLDNKSLVWQTNTQEVTQLDQYGPIPPNVFASTDCIATWDRYLFVSRSGRLIVMREFGNEGSWTELVLPTGVTATSMCEVGNSLYFVGTDGTNNQVWRYVLYPENSATLEVGKSNNTYLDLTISTRPVGEPNRFEKQSWFRIGLRARGDSNSNLKSIESWNGSTLVSGTSSLLTTTFSPAKSITPRFEVVVPAHGPTIEALAKITLQGDVEIEAVTFYVHGKTPRRV